MPRTIGLVAILMCAVVAAFGGASAQTVSPEACIQTARAVLANEGSPDFHGCPGKAAASLLRASHIEFRYDEQPVAGVTRGIVADQRQVDGVVHLIVSTGAAAPPPPPIPAAAVVVPPPAGVPGAAAAAVPPPPPAVSKPVSFSIADAVPAEEGKAIVFHITRTGDDGQAHEIGLDYPKNANLLVEHPRSFRFEPGEPSQRDLSLNTVPGLPGDGPHDVEVALVPTRGIEIGVPRVGTGTITDVPLPPQPTYSITPDGPASREQDVSFTLTRTAPLTPATVPYRVEQDQNDLFADALNPPQAKFPEGERSTRIVIPAAQFSPCGGPLIVRLSQPEGTEISAAAEFSEPVPAWCNPTPDPWWKRLLIWMQDNWPAVLGGVALIAGTVAHHILPRPTVDIEPSLEIESGTASFQPLEEPASRWPKFGADVTIEPGDSYVTQPLPALEPDDG